MRVIPYLQWWQIIFFVSIPVLLIIAIAAINRLDETMKSIYRLEKVRMLEDGLIDEETNTFKNWVFNGFGHATRKSKSIIK